jgi:hypothetical protein
MQEHDSLPVCRSIWRDIHVAHAERLPLDCEIKEVHWIRIVDILNPDAKRTQSGRLRFCAGNQCDSAPNTSAQYLVKLPRMGLTEG